MIRRKIKTEKWLYIKIVVSWCVTAGAGLLLDAEGGAEGGGGGVQSSGTAEPGVIFILAAFL